MVISGWLLVDDNM